MEKTTKMVVVVEGNIGSGKTTFLSHFNNAIQEPVSMWRDCDGYNLLDLMYKDPKKWSFTFQSYVQLTMLQQHQKVVPEPIKLMERSIYSVRYCFIEKMIRDGMISQPSIAVLDEWFKYIISLPFTKVDLIVYLRTTPEIAYNRILERNVPEEKTISFEYIKSLHDIYEDWLYNKLLYECPAPVLCLNGDLNESSLIVEEYMKNIKGYQNDM